jgi:Mg-chelatase subunit ChlD
MLLSRLLKHHRGAAPLARSLKQRSAPLVGLLKDCRGGVAPMFALAIIPVIGFAGAAVDYSRASAVRTNMQAAADATSLAMSKLAASLTENDLKTKAAAYFAASFKTSYLKSYSVTPTYTNLGGGGSQLVIAVSGTLDTQFMGLMGFGSLDIGTSSTVKWGNQRLRVALALDNTGSMKDDGKIGALKTATKNLLTQLKTAASTNGDVYVSIIPFSRDVNARDLGDSSSDWIRWTRTGSDTDSWDDNNGNCKSYSGGPEPQDKATCSNKGGTWKSDKHSTWNGCIMDRDKDYDVTNTAPSSATPATLFPAQQYGSCPVPMMGLTYDWNALNTKVDDMVANGNTNQAIGLAWAWQSLTAAPFTIPPKDPNYKYSDVIILMSDGLNTQNRWTTDQATIDAREATMCANVKAAGITIYTIHVNTNGDPTSQVLKNCATTTSNFYTVTSSGQIDKVFSQIGTQLSQLRISK